MHDSFLRLDSRYTVAAIALLLSAFPLSAPAQNGSPLADDTAEAPDPEVRFTKAVRIPDAVFEEETSALLLPSEPPEYGEDRMLQSRGAVGKLPEEIPLLPEGYVVAAREATIERSGEWAVAHLKEDPELPSARPLRLLPNPRLEMIDAILRQSAADRVFVITGRVTEFQGENYLLLEIIAERAIVPPAPKPEPKPATTNPENQPLQPEIIPLNGDSAAGTAPVEGNSVLQQEPSAESVIESLLEDRPLKSVVIPEPSPAVTPEVKVEGGDVKITPIEPATTGRSTSYANESFVIDRPGRVLPDGDGWSFAFENRGNHPSDKPLRLLPNRLLETALAQSAGGSRGVVFLVTGEVTVYKGRSYMLLRKVIARRDLGNLR